MTWKHSSSSHVSQKQPVSGGSVYSEFQLMQFTGLNNRDASIHIDTFQASDLMNVHFDNMGSITKRNGYTPYVPASISNKQVTSLFTFYKSDGTKHLLATIDDSLYEVANSNIFTATWSDYKTNTWNSFASTLTWNDIESRAFRSIASGLHGKGNRFTATVYYDKLYMLNGDTTDGLMKWDGSAFSQVKNAPNGKYVTLYKNRLYICGDPNNPSRLYMSDLGLPESWPELNFIDIDTNDGDMITGMCELMDSLVIFKERSIHVLRGTGPQNYNMTNTHQQRGTVSHWSIVPIMNRLYFLARDGVYSFDGHNVHLESDLIKGSVLGLNNNQAWNQMYLSNACAVEYKNKYWLAVTEGQAFTNNRVYVFDYTHGFWTRYGIPVSCLAMYQDPKSPTMTLFSGDPVTGIVYQQDTGTDDNGQAITAYFKTKDFDFGSAAHYKSYKGLFFAAEQQINNYSINVTYIMDRGAKSKTVPLSLGNTHPSLWGTFKWGIDPWGGQPDVAKKTTSVSGASRYLSFKVSDTSTNPWIFLGWVLRYQVKRRMA